jgi:hypothetical protein
MNLLNLAAPIQQSLIDIAPPVQGKDQVTERQLRPLLESILWSDQMSGSSVTPKLATMAPDTYSVVKL